MLGAPGAGRARAQPLLHDLRLPAPRARPGTLDTRVPALWISNGTGRDGQERKDAPKVGWCWAGNHHTWLGIASVAGRHA
ncbi:DUF5701 family protein [Ornithinimicrobium flavum]|uniref:DUF5701 family protein n=1 Tax=Ornithinimicrobium flavum TaxID=1288636 RepID=UPI001EE7D64B|nr:DUF5701 family protein [Ornithinimicrobium flavum]